MIHWKKFLNRVGTAAGSGLSKSLLGFLCENPHEEALGVKQRTQFSEGQVPDSGQPNDQPRPRNSSSNVSQGLERGYDLKAISNSELARLKPQPAQASTFHDLIDRSHI